MASKKLRNWHPGDDKAGSGAGAKIGDVLPPLPPPPGETYRPRADGVWKDGACADSLDHALELIERGADPQKIIRAMRERSDHRHIFDGMPSGKSNE